MKDPTNKTKTTGVVAQFWLEHRPVTPEVASSSLVYPATRRFSLRSAFRLCIVTPDLFRGYLTRHPQRHPEHREGSSAVFLTLSPTLVLQSLRTHYQSHKSRPQHSDREDTRRYILYTQHRKVLFYANFPFHKFFHFFSKKTRIFGWQDPEYLYIWHVILRL